MNALSPSDRLTQREQDAVYDFLQRLQRGFGRAVRQTTLFGSKARGDSGPDSDIDILVIVDEESWSLRDSVSVIASRVSLEYGVLIGPRVIGQERWERMARENLSLYQNITREGISITPEPA
jgi:predicted nucleotidyltransferase